MPEVLTPSLHLDLRDCRAHLLQVTLQHQPSRPGRLRLQLPAWTPGSYLIRDYVRQLEGLVAEQGGRSLPLERLDLARWAVELRSIEPLTLRYCIQATELTVRTCHLDSDHGFLALAAVALELEGQRWQPHRLSLSLPPEWEAFVPLPRQDDGSWLACDFDQLVDTPIEAGPHPSHGFAVAGVPHRWVSWGRTLEGDDPADPDWLAAVEQVCLACCRLMGVERPAADHYLFVLHCNDNGYGGLEHDLSTVLQFGRRRLAAADGRRKLLQLVAHEYLHQWNVRRLRPRELRPYDYGRPVLIPTLWFAEGVTSYVDQLLPHAADLCSEAEVLADLSADLSRYLTTPGRGVQSLRLSGQEAWVKLYKADAYSANSQVSYYLKGAVLALVLDLRLRRSGSCLARVLQALWRSHGACGRGYSEADLLAAFSAEQADLATLLPQWLESLEDPPLLELLEDVGLRLVPQAPAPQERWLGWQLEASPAGPLLQRVERHGPAEAAGLMVGDELIALAEQRLRTPEEVALVAGRWPLGRRLPLAYARDGRLRYTELEPLAPQPRQWQLQSDPAAPAAALERRRRWLRLEPEPA